MLVDLHLHTRAISHCCRIEAEDNIKLAKELGFDGVAIANHYTSHYFDEKSYDSWIDSYIAEWYNCIALGKKYGLRIFCAVEVTLEYEPRLHMLIYGADRQFLIDNPHLCDMSLEKLYSLCRANGYALVQAHPFRGGTTVQDTKFLDGVEINCHPLYKNSYYEELLQAAENANLAVTVGCDYHADTYRPIGGTFLPDSIVSDRDLAEYILSSREFSLQVHDPVDGKTFNLNYQREKNA